MQEHSNQVIEAQPLLPLGLSYELAARVLRMALGGRLKCRPEGPTRAPYQQLVALGLAKVVSFGKHTHQNILRANTDAVEVLRMWAAELSAEQQAGLDLAYALIDEENTNARLVQNGFPDKQTYNYVPRPDGAPAPMPAYTYKEPAIVSEVPRHADGTGEPYRWNVIGVCINPDTVYQAEHGKNDNLDLIAALAPDGRWRASFSYNYSTDGPGGASGPVSLIGPSFATKEEAIRARAEALLGYPNIKCLHKKLRAALEVQAAKRSLPTPEHRKPSAKAVSQPAKQLNLFGEEVARG